MSIDHSQDQLPSQYYDARELSRDCDVRIIGSMGRAAIMGRIIPHVSDQGVVRNINVLHTSPLNFQRYGSTHVTFGDSIVSTRYDQWIRTDETGTRLVFPVNPEISVLLDEPEEVLQPNKVEIGGAEIVTVLPEVLSKINGLMLLKRPKDRKNFLEFDTYLKQQGIQNTIDLRLLNPFEEFEAMLKRQRKYRMKGMARNVYHQLLSESARGNLNLGARIPYLPAIPRVDDLQGDQN